MYANRQLDMYLELAFLLIDIAIMSTTGQTETYMRMVIHVYLYYLYIYIYEFAMLLSCHIRSHLNRIYIAQSTFH